MSIPPFPRVGPRAVPVPRVILIALLHLTGTPFMHAQMLETLYSFQLTNGAQPQCVLVQASNSMLYGTTRFGGVNNRGTVFKYASNGTLTTLFKFDGGADGRNPQSGLMRASNGNLYGTTVNGTDGPTIFRITPDDAFATVASFFTNDQVVFAPLTQGRDGNLYGVSSSGGIPNDYGSIFKVTLDTGVLTRIATFYSTNGASPRSQLLEMSDGSFYGATYLGGLVNYSGIVFQVTTNGMLHTVATFTGTNGARPLTGLFQANNGDLYGTASEGGTNNLGTIYGLTTNGAITTLTTFDGTNGWSPQGELMQATDGNIYGVTVIGGVSNLGTVFRLAPGGTLTTIVEFTGTNGARPVGGLMQAADGNLYGTTYRGGTTDSGTIYRIVLPTAPTVSLNAIRSGNNIILRWPTNAALILERTMNLTPPITWTNANESPSVVGTNFVVTNSAITPAHFYRLKGM